MKMGIWGVVCAALFILTGCTGVAGTDQADTSLAEVSKDPASVTDDVFLATLAQEGVMNPDLTEAEHIDLAKEFCGWLNDGVPLETVMMEYVTADDPESVGYFMGAAVAAYCPQHEQQFYEIYSYSGYMES